ncbi:hypothetical protein LTS07_009518 [Exophiala sideris]|uniref:Nephrocystin 3-like N-terminal domain-containing protein n=1 Tax=Exophiala sideris TaxID=1016849 RepID=A0ABR0IZ29_9EURO|nr:hypothetical protein LTS07_009518 [Exophiala sideris]KAK5026750.1 hypothetical protein LTR13_009790 [Exophiala sideris]KAK5052403.1 hypothetical protein LTR69_009741 [Exophiala sideris]KAK5178188.1 hypothetical protein LTR44_009272 [Eurotiomycetes sp. CCFEE 6388]
MALRQQSIRSPMQNTCDWLFQDKTYLNWYYRRDLDSHQGLLWIKGKPGSGKSTLMKEAVRRASLDEDAEDRIVMSYFFNARGNQLEGSALGLFRSLILQLIHGNPKVEGEFLKLYLGKKLPPPEQGVPPKTVEWHQVELEDFLENSLPFWSTMQRVEIYIDALDECDELEARTVVEFFRELTFSAFDSGLNVNVCVSSRHYPHISVQSCPEVVVEQGNNGYIQNYVQKTLKRTYAPYQASLQNIAETVIRKASGVFLWVVLVLQMLREDVDRGSTTEAMQLKLDRIPTKMADLFTQLFNDRSIEDREEALQLWRWVILAERPLRLPELYIAMDFARHGVMYKLDLLDLDIQPQDHQTDFQTELARFRLRILYLSRGLLDVEFVDSPIDNTINRALEGRVQPIHETVKEFVVQKGFTLFTNDAESATTGQGHVILSKTCVDYLCSPELIRVLDNKARLDSLLKQFGRCSAILTWFVYAVDHCLDHARRADKHRCVAAHFLHDSDLWKYNSIRGWQMFNNTYTRATPDLPRGRYKTVLSFLCDEQLFFTAAHLVKRPDFRVHGTDSRGYTPLHEICREPLQGLDGKVSKLAKILMRRGADPRVLNSYGASPVDIARSRDLKKTLRVLAPEASSTRLGYSSTDTPDDIPTSKGRAQLLTGLDNGLWFTSIESSSTNELGRS